MNDGGEKEGTVNEGPTSSGSGSGGITPPCITPATPRHEQFPNSALKVPESVNSANNAPKGYWSPGRAEIT